MTIEEFLRACAEAGAAQQVSLVAYVGKDKTAVDVKAVKLVMGELAVQLEPR